MIKGVALVQEGLRELGYDPGPIDGLHGPRTSAAYKAGMAAFAPTATKDAGEPPWITEGMKTLGWHEVNDKAKLAAWLKSGGKALGDPAKLPWCGDWAETTVAKTLPNEKLPENPFFAQNWATFGVPTPPVRWCFGVIRWSPSSGHVCNILGQHGANYVVLGGNQRDRVSIAEFPKSAFIAFRMPATYPALPNILPNITADDLITSIAATR